MISYSCLRFPVSFSSLTRYAMATVLSRLPLYIHLSFSGVESS